MTNSAQKQIIDLIRRSNKILILPSAPPDGDSLGAAIALYLTLKKLKKEVTVACKEDIPELLQFLPNIKIVGNKMLSSADFIITLDCRKTEIHDIKAKKENSKINIIITPREGRFSEDDISYNKGKIDYDLIITVDCAELSQLKEIYEENIELFHQIPIINIDHHISNAHFGKINYVDIMASATTELLLPIIEELAREEGIDLMDEDIATLLLTGIITDTGSFQNANTTPKSFAKAAQLIGCGARQQEIIQHIYKTKQLSQLKLWGRVLSKIQTDEKYRIVWSAVSQQDFKDTESAEEQTGDIIDELMTNAPGAEVILLLKEKQDKGISVSVRTTAPSIDASKLAEHFGGGGHARAAGFRITEMSLREAEYKVIEYIKEIQKERLGIIVKQEPMINVKELINRAHEAEKAQEIISKVAEHEEAKPGQEEKILQPKTEQEEPSQEEEIPQESVEKRKRGRPKKDQTFQFNLKEETNHESGIIYKFED